MRARELAKKMDISSIAVDGPSPCPVDLHPRAARAGLAVGRARVLRDASLIFGFEFSRHLGWKPEDLSKGNAIESPPPYDDNSEMQEWGQAPCYLLRGDVTSDGSSRWSCCSDELALVHEASPMLP